MNNLQLIEKVLYYIDEHIYEELTYERLAEVSGYSSFYFHKIFSSVTKASHIKGFKGKWEYPWVVTYHGEVIGQIQLFNFLIIILVQRLVISLRKLIETMESTQRY